MSKEAMIHQLLAIRSLVDSVLAEITEQPAETGQCEHKRTENLTVMGGAEKYRCLDCGEELLGEDFITNKLKKGDES